MRFTSDLPNRHRRVIPGTETRDTLPDSLRECHRVVDLPTLLSRNLGSGLPVVPHPNYCWTESESLAVTCGLEHSACRQGDEPWAIG